MFSPHPYFFSKKCLVLLVNLLTYHVTNIYYLVLKAFDCRRKYSGFATPMKVSIKCC